MNEIWKPIPDFPGYEVSDHGQVRSYWRSLGDAKGYFLSDTPQRFLSLNYKRRYVGVRLCRDGKRITQNIHRLILLAFVGPCPSRLQACHNDGNKKNNCLSNLRWDTPKNNCADRTIHGKSITGTRNPKAKLNKREVANIRELHSLGYSCNGISKIYNMCVSTIARIISGKYWAHI